MQKKFTRVLLGLDGISNKERLRQDLDYFLWRMFNWKLLQLTVHGLVSEQCSTY